MTRRRRSSRNQTTALTSLDATTIDGIPVTTVARTLLDLAEVLPQHQLAAALSEAERQNVLDVHALEAAMRRSLGPSARLRAKGYEVTEITHHQLTKQSQWVAHQLRLLLDAKAP